MIKKIAISIALIFITALPSFANATGLDSMKTNLRSFGGSLGYNSSETDLIGKIGGVINIVLGILGVVAVAYIIYAGFKWVTAAGNEDHVKEAKSTIKNAIIGIAIVFLSYVIINFVVDQLSTMPGDGTAGEGPVSGPKACVYEFNGCQDLCIPSNSSCPLTQQWTECKNAGGDNLGYLSTGKSGNGTCDEVCGDECSRR